MTPCDVALLTAAPYLLSRPDDWYISQIHQEEALLADALRQLGFTVERVDWADPEYRWEEARVAVFRTTWDYFDRFPEFMQWLGGPATRTELINSRSLVLWNVDKHYLGDLANKQISIVPTEFVEQGQQVSLEQIVRRRGWGEIVVKPVVSGAARLTFRADPGSLSTLEPIFAQCVHAEAMMVQPFQPEILSTGELSLIVVGGRYTHAIRKTPKAGDFRVQDDHGGTVHPYTPGTEEIVFAERAVAACAELPLYARVDLVTTRDGCRLMELELIEPELFLRFCPDSAVCLAEEIATRLSMVSANKV